MSLQIREEEAGDRESIQEIHRAAFDSVAEPRLIDGLWAGGHVRLSLVAEQEGQILGHILFSELAIVGKDGSVPALALAPMAVAPVFQRRGVGSALVRRGLELCQARGHRVVIVVGHPSFYPRFGFSAARAARLQSRYAGEAFMAVELAPGALEGVTGRVLYPPPFDDL
jgi:putative acetyltransferase